MFRCLAYETYSVHFVVGLSTAKHHYAVASVTIRGEVPVNRNKVWSMLAQAKAADGEVEDVQHADCVHSITQLDFRWCEKSIIHFPLESTDKVAVVSLFANKGNGRTKVA